MASRWSVPLRRRDLIPNYLPVFRDIRLSKCESCRRVFTNKEDLKQHIALSHTGSKPHACAICGKRYSQLHYLNSHFKLHREPRLQEFAILKHRMKSLSVPPSPVDTAVGSFRVPKAMKNYASQPTFTSFGTLQSFTITQINKPSPEEQQLKGKRQLPHKSENSITSVTNSINDRRKLTNEQTSSEFSTHKLPDINRYKRNATRDSETQTTNLRVSSNDSKNKTLVKDYWSDTNSEWQIHKSKKRSDIGRRETSFVGHGKLDSREFVSFKASTPKDPMLYWDEPDSVLRGMSGIETITGYDPANYTQSGRRQKRQRSN